MRAFTLAATVIAAGSVSLFAQGTLGTGNEAKAMLQEAEAAVKADKAKVTEMFNKGEGGFRDRDLYVFCAQVADGKIIALGNQNAQQLLGTDTRNLKDAAGKAFGNEMFEELNKADGEISTVDYAFSRLGNDKTPVAKQSFVTKIGDIGCGVGYYK